MTDEEMAEKYAKGLCKTCKVDVCRYSKIKTCTTKESLKQAYLAGLKDCKHDNKSCPNDESCVHYNKWEEYKNQQLTKAKELIKEMLSILPKENIEDIYEITEEAEQFINEVEK